MSRRGGLIVIAWLAAALALQAQRGGRPAFRSAIQLTTVTATVIDADGALVKGLPQEVFEIFEDGQPQTITHFTNERVPVSLAVLLDVSDSMFGTRLRDAQAAIVAFVTDLVDRGDEYTLVAFNHKQQRLTNWTAEGSRAPEVMSKLYPSGSTAIYDALVATLPMAASRTRPRAALLVLSDGADTASDATLRDVRDRMLRSDAFVYAVAIDPTERRPINTPVNVGALSEITGQSGGRTIVVHNAADIGMALADIADELNHQYLIGYSSSHGNDGKFHSIRVRVPGGTHRVRARSGYVARDQD